MQLVLKEKGSYTYIDEGEGETLLLLHGLFGALSNWNDVVDHFSKRYRVIIPMLPIVTMPLRQAGLNGLCNFVEGFVKEMNLSDMTLIGNSLGGHVAILYAMEHSSQVKRIVLTGSSGLFEDSMGASFPKRGNYEFVKERVGYTFYDPSTAKKELVDEVFETLKSAQKCLRIIAIAKSAQRNNLSEDLHKLTQPTLLVWGLNDTITPPMVAHEFHRLIPNSKLEFIDKCSHAPMMERPQEFNKILDDYLTHVA